MGKTVREITEKRRTAFYMQYTALMLLIVCFIVGTRFRPKEELVPQAHLSLPQVEEASDKFIGEQDLSKLFSEDESINSELAGAFVEFLGAHDVNAQVVQYVKEDHDVSHALSRVMVLAQYFSQKPIPGTAYRFSIHECAASESTDCEFDQETGRIFWEREARYE